VRISGVRERSGTIFKPRCVSVSAAAAFCLRGKKTVLTILGFLVLKLNPLEVISLHLVKYNDNGHEYCSLTSVLFPELKAAPT
jgi:hypothetical protein